MSSDVEQCRAISGDVPKCRNALIQAKSARACHPNSPCPSHMEEFVDARIVGLSDVVVESSAANLVNMAVISAVGAMSVSSGVNQSLAARIECITNICFMFLTCLW